MGFITLGIFALRGDGADGAVLQMVNHGLVVAPLLLICALLAERAGSEDLNRMGGLAKHAPYLAVLFLVVTMATLAMPGSANFIGEFFILNGAFQAKIAIAIVASAGVAGAAFYSLRLYQRTMHNRLPEGAQSREPSLGEGVVLTGLVACIVALALYPGFVLDRTEADANAQLQAVTPTEVARR
jgi:NADH-quinone oxidoreductase subunit M